MISFQILKSILRNYFWDAWIMISSMMTLFVDNCNDDDPHNSTVTCKDLQKSFKETTSKYWRRFYGGDFEQCKLSHFPFHPWTNLVRIPFRGYLRGQSWMQMARPVSRKVLLLWFTADTAAFVGKNLFGFSKSPREVWSIKLCLIIFFAQQPSDGNWNSAFSVEAYLIF